ncbi:pyridoxal phosphate-dependent aminotransferase [Legionella longbeachae]|uniref:Aminotransferase n=1 Tax=Legionella longbeachae serogroup 1 (strain NSW150) TaxID=661367 RepID=D3HS05_LEGLN|nr:aminotransferase class I/II-fold pyridoxal phosphate-dependent enzyme [Legionella longbeachae]VEE02186.1 aspartate aminotransferase [Legionella oakridgensis]HBD7396572.1 aminotransferase class I/II-fold pyridoxal phosphate-dependent enzyme [Legionella pneumophila]ARB91512.1 aspartate aminotransferase [Legionella longbeachae]ARM32062.1 aminotransferase class I/II-fold pyridoxal phosphate-dependent enzyme [Legionella longbeachae]EEZ95187.1 aspartate aminotransferase [Legionella longbeachae D-
MNHSKQFSLKDSATVAINSLAQQKINAGLKIYNLSAGEPKLPPHPIIISAVTHALEQGLTHYPPVSGISELRYLACEWMNKSYNCSFTSENCLVVNGGKFGIYLLMQLLIQNNDEVIIPSPYWVSYPQITCLFGGTPTIVETREIEGWKLTPQALKNACGPKSKILILNNAANPTGVLYTKSELAALLQVAHEHDLLVIADEVYSGLIYDGHTYISCGSFSQFKDRIIIIQSCSKNFSMTGWRVGFVFAPKTITQPLTALMSQSTSGVTSLSQWAAVAVLKEIKIGLWVQQRMWERRNCIIHALDQYLGLTIPPPPSSLYIYLSLNKLGVKNQSSEDFCQQALEEANVALVPGTAFGNEGYIRLSFGGCEEELLSGIQKLARWLHF